MTSETPKHSPLPWVYTKDEYGVRRIASRTADGLGPALFCDEPYYPWCADEDTDWELIVRCVNSHEVLVNALKAAREALADAAAQVGLASNHTALTSWPDQREWLINEIGAVTRRPSDQIDAALKLAEGQ